MKTEEGNKGLEAIIQKAAKDFNPGEIAKDLMTLRETALEEQDPLVVKLLRLSKEYILENGEFLTDFEGTEIELEEGETTFGYFLELMKSAENKYNREELQEIRDILMG